MTKYSKVIQLFFIVRKTEQSPILLFSENPINCILCPLLLYHTKSSFLHHTSSTKTLYTIDPTVVEFKGKNSTYTGKYQHFPKNNGRISTYMNLTFRFSHTLVNFTGISPLILPLKPQLNVIAGLFPLMSPIPSPKYQFSKKSQPRKD